MGWSLTWAKEAMWPVWNLAAMLLVSRTHIINEIEGRKTYVPNPSASPTLSLAEHATSCLAALRSFLLAILCVYVIHGGTDEVHGYPAFGRGKTLAWSWVWPLLVRNLLATWLIAGSWDWLLYYSPLAPALKKYKFNAVMPSSWQFKHDAFFTTLATLCATAIEVALCYYWARGSISMQRGITWWTVVQGLTIAHWRVPHFHFIHRVMHPWRLKGLPRNRDPGFFLYRHIHSLHHKSYNPTAFSGTSMHPVESTLYYSAALVPVVLFHCHPTIALGCLIDCGVGAWLGHDGFQWPGSGDYFHQLHHANFDCNFGAPHVPLDKLFGSFVTCKNDMRMIWYGVEAGAEANTTPLHAQ